MTIAITGITGNMGQATLAALKDIPELHKIKLLSHTAKRTEKLLKQHKDILHKIESTEGGTNDREAIAKLIDGVDLVINMAAVIPPRSDKNPKAAIACNEYGAETIVSEIEKIKDAQPALIHISTVALYGNRSTEHPFARVGDPLLVSPFDVYSATKLRGEFRVLESDIKNWAVLRQTAMLHPQMLAENVSDGLMYHTVFDAPLEWATAHDSGLLMRNIVKAFITGKMPNGFWKRCHNITGGKVNREYGYQTFDKGFAIIGGNTKDFFRPGHNGTRNFHGVWYSDGDELNDMFDYQRQTTTDYWREIFRTHPIFKLGKIVPKAAIRQFLFKRLLRDDNAPSYWAKHNDDARITAHFGSRENYDKLQKLGWDEYTLPDSAKIAEREDERTHVFYGFDFDKADGELTHADVAEVAKAHGGQLLGTFDGDMYKKLDWLTQDGEKFTANAYTVLRAGHWYNPIYKSFVWDFDRLAKKDKVFASVWYDSHERDEDLLYSMDDEFNAHMQKIQAEPER